MLTNSWVEPAGCFFYVVDVVDITFRSDALFPAERQWAEVVWWRRNYDGWYALVTVLEASASLFVWTSSNIAGTTFTVIISSLLLLLLPHALRSTAITTSSCQQPLISTTPPNRAVTQPSQRPAPTHHMMYWLMQSSAMALYRSTWLAAAPSHSNCLHSHSPNCISNWTNRFSH